MRWDNLFDDLESQIAGEIAAEELDVRAEEERLRVGKLTLQHRIAALTAQQPDAPIALVVAGERLEVRVETVGRDWLAGRARVGAHSQQVVVFMAAVWGLAVPPARARASAESDAPGRRASRLGATAVLRDLARRRHPVTVHAAGPPEHGTVDRVGGDHLDLAVHEPGVPRRDSAVRETRIVPFAQLSLLRL